VNATSMTANMHLSNQTLLENGIW